MNFPDSERARLIEAEWESTGSKEEKYGADDSSKIIEIINFQIETVNKYKNVLTDDGYRLLIKIYSGLKELVESKII